MQKERIIKREDGAITTMRALAYQFLQLPDHVKVKIAHDLDLTSILDTELTEIEKAKQYFKRANDQEKLLELWDKIKPTTQ